MGDKDRTLPSGDGSELLTEGPDVRVPMPHHGGAPPCPVKWCGYRCGCCCHHLCQTPCPAPDEDGDCDCATSCHGGHKPWECNSFSTRYGWARRKSQAIEASS